eukprot:symbB.v1.2.023926.t1/scaffold2227.1/size85294/3
MGPVASRDLPVQRAVNPLESLPSQWIFFLDPASLL